MSEESTVRTTREQICAFCSAPLEKLIELYRFPWDRPSRPETEQYDSIVYMCSMCGADGRQTLFQPPRPPMPIEAWLVIIGYFGLLLWAITR